MDWNRLRRGRTYDRQLESLAKGIAIVAILAAGTLGIFSTVDKASAQNKVETSPESKDTDKHRDNLNRQFEQEELARHWLVMKNSLSNLKIEGTKGKLLKFQFTIGLKAGQDLYAKEKHGSKDFRMLVVPKDLEWDLDVKAEMVDEDGTIQFDFEVPKFFPFKKVRKLESRIPGDTIRLFISSHRRIQRTNLTLTVQNENLQKYNVELVNRMVTIVRRNTELIEKVESEDEATKKELKEKETKTMRELRASRDELEQEAKRQKRETKRPAN